MVAFICSTPRWVATIRIMLPTVGAVTVAHCWRMIALCGSRGLVPTTTRMITISLVSSFSRSSSWTTAIFIAHMQWPVCGEVDHGLVGGIAAARTVLFDDPIFGLIAYGGEVVRREGEAIAVIPRDGVRQRFSALFGGRRLHVELDQDGFAAGQPVRVGRDFKSFEFTLENRGARAQVHVTKVEITGLPAGRYRARTVNGWRELRECPEDGRLDLFWLVGGERNETVEVRMEK